MEWVKPFFQWAADSRLGTAIAAGTYPFAVIEVIHLFGLTLVLGGVTFMSMRLFGLIMRDQPLSQFSRGVSRWTFVGMLISATTGAGLYASEAMKLYASPSFWVKMGLFFPAVLFHFTLYRKVTHSDRSGPLARGLTAIAALFLWFGVGWAGRAIGFL